VAIAKAVEECCHGGQILISGDSFSQINGLLTQLQSPQVVDLGEHMLQVHGLADAVHPTDVEVRLLQLVPETLAHNHFSCPACSAGGCGDCTGGRVFPQLSTKAQITPGFHAAPAGSSITLCFVFTKGARDLVASDTSLASHALGMLRHCVRDLLTANGRNGYECQEDEGAFMLAFPNLSETAAFACDLQMELAELPWQDELRVCGPAFEQGLRVGIGALHGSYTSRGPHATTGRADYFGTIVNRTARIAQAAHAGQVLFGADASMSCSSKSKMQLPAGTALERLGAYAFKGIEGSLAVHELRIPNSDGEVEIFPELKCKGRVSN
jgi:class 3 adenylate cyclase